MKNGDGPAGPVAGLLGDLVKRVRELQESSLLPQRSPLALEPIHQLQQLEDGWRSLGGDPQFLIRCDLKPGWNEVRFYGRTRSGAGAMVLYLARGGTFSAERAHALGLMGDAGRWHTRYIYLSEPCTAVRFDPLDCGGEFDVSDFTIGSVKSPAPALRLGRDVVRYLAGNGRPSARSLARKALRAGLRPALRETISEFVTRSTSSGLPAETELYQHYVRRVTLSEEELREQRLAAEALPRKPLFSIVVPVYNVEAQWLTAMVDSVRAQTYGYWELCLADDASTQPHVRPALERFARLDPRIKVTFRSENGHISQATNSAMELATGDYYCLLDNDDEIDPSALFEFARLLNEDPHVDMVYSDEDKLSLEGIRYEPFFKPEWSPDYLESAMYTAHFACYRKSIADQIGRFRSECNGAQDYDFVLRFTEKTERIAHIPKVLYHWRAIPGSTAAAMSGKSYVLDAAIRALEGRLERTGRKGTAAVSRYPGCFDLRSQLPRRPLVSIVIPSAGRRAMVRGVSIDLLANCVQTIGSRSSYDAYEIIVIDNGDLADSTRAAIDKAGVRLTTFQGPLNIARKINRGAAMAKGEFLLILNDDIEVINEDWLEALLERAMLPGVGVVGPLLLYENGTIQHAGVAFCSGLPDHVRRHYPREDPGYFFSTVSARNYSAVTGACMLTPRKLFEQVGGYTEAFPINYNDIDYCLKCGELGQRTTYTPHARLYHFESVSRVASVPQSDIDLFLERWAHLSFGDPFYNDAVLATRPPNFILRGDFR